MSYYYYWQLSKYPLLFIAYTCVSKTCFNCTLSVYLRGGVHSNLCLLYMIEKQARIKIFFEQPMLKGIYRRPPCMASHFMGLHVP